MEGKDLKVIDAHVVNLEDYAMDVESIVKQVKVIQEVMAKVMREDEHYGIIPGTTKPSLLKPGAEKLSMTFRFAPSFDIIMRDFGKAHREYEVRTFLDSMVTGQRIGEGVGSCSTMESKYRFRKAEQKCPECGKETIIKGKKEYGGGWLCWGKKGGCGEKFKDGDPQIENQDMGRIEYDNPADYYNTCLKMAKKRSHVDAILTATAASDIFTQDLEDLKANGMMGDAIIPKAKEKEKGKVENKEKKSQENYVKSIEEFRPKVSPDDFNRVLDELEIKNWKGIRDRERQTAFYVKLRDLVKGEGKGDQEKQTEEPLSKPQNGKTVETLHSFVDGIQDEGIRQGVVESINSFPRTPDGHMTEMGFYDAIAKVHIIPVDRMDEIFDGRDPKQVPGDERDLIIAKMLVEAEEMI